MIVGVARETYPGEQRVAVVPATLPTLAKAGIEVVLESGAGHAAGFRDSDYLAKGAKVVTTRDEVFRADVMLQVRSAGANPTLGEADLARTRPGQVFIGMCEPLSEPQAVAQWAAAGATVFALELLPRITRAQSMDVLSSMATIAGYEAVLMAAQALPKIFPMLMTAAGTITPAKVFIVGAGVAGLQAIATARRLGAVVSAYDVRPAVKEQVQSLGAKFVEMKLEAAEGAGGYARAMDEDFYRRQRQMMAEVVAQQDVVITTAAVPGQKAPVLITAEMVAGMKPGAVIVDLAAERGGNCELTEAGTTVERDGVKILGPVNLPSEAARDASQMYARNLATFLTLLVKEGRVNLNMEDEIIRDTLVARDGNVVHPRVRQLLALDPPPAPQS